MGETNDNSAAAPRPACQNCGVPLLGEHCHACGQPVKGLVRHFSSIIGDLLDTVFNIDARVFRTLWPLFTKPGMLSLEYFAGHRIRYVSPVRLFVFLSIVAFFVAQLSVDFSGVKVGFDGGDSQIAKATTVAQVNARRDAAVKELEKAKRDTKDTPGVGVGLDAAITTINGQADRRIAMLEAASKAGKPPPAPGIAAEEADDDEISFNGKPWDPVKNPLHVDWLPDAGNKKLNDMAGHLRDNVHRGEKDPNLIKDAVLSTVPTALILMLPLFALMLKIAYAFKRRLYMEHLIVALHSHAFLCLALLVMFGLMALQDSVGAMASPLHSLIKLGEVALGIWMPLYLLIMQKRVYGQGWTMTLLKYCVLGLCYSVLLSIGAAFTMLAGLVWM
ncbi:putative membrane protein [Lysobacter dokdonensis DS-58]|uniref:Putative membrane protein n=1 Tax=Lysobacter dokdonensis DS-58 TaxID=1300345 RepID=A0A0A2WE88_9GAMM|nr:DUF3667 domain-containing protein [Lysobacter dokdonensis]KGQ18048.1 putative membrane protein [Lysobacter dokdonensis DS-58]